MTLQDSVTLKCVYKSRYYKYVPKAKGQHFLLCHLGHKRLQENDDRKRVYVRDSIEAKKCHAVA